ADALADRGGEDGFVGLGGEMAAARFHRDVKSRFARRCAAHGYSWPLPGVSKKGRWILPSIDSPLGARPSRFRRQRVLIVGCGDVGLRAAGLLRGRVRMLAWTG